MADRPAADRPAIVLAPGQGVVVVADGDVDPVRLRALAMGDSGDPADSGCPSDPGPPGAPGARPLIVAADGAAAKVLAADLRPDLVIGDGDSLDPLTRERLAALRVPTRETSAEKDESDTELCLLAALEAGALRISLVGAFGGPRPEHSLANLFLLADGRFDGLEITASWGESRLRRTGRAAGPGDIRVAGAAGDWLSLLPLDAAVIGVRTDGLRYPLRGETLSLGPSRGLSNELSGASARVTTERGRLLVMHTPRTAADVLPPEPRLAPPGGPHA